MQIYFFKILFNEFISQHTDAELLRKIHDEVNTRILLNEMRLKLIKLKLIKLKIYMICSTNSLVEKF